MDKRKRISKLEEAVAGCGLEAEAPCNLKPLSLEETVEVLNIARDCNVINKILPPGHEGFVERVLGGDPEAIEWLRKASS